MPIKQINFFNIILLVVVIFLVAPLLRAYSEAPELIEEFVCDSSSISTSYDSIVPSVSANNLSYQIHDNKNFLEEAISYLAKYEKSPPIAII